MKYSTLQGSQKFMANLSYKPEILAGLIVEATILENTILVSDSII